MPSCTNWSVPARTAQVLRRERKGFARQSLGAEHGQNLIATAGRFSVGWDGQLEWGEMESALPM